MIKVMIADDQTILAEGIKSVLETSDQIEVIALVSDGAEAIRKIAENKPDVVLLDIRMPNMNGVVATKEIKTRWPEIKVIILTTFDDSDYILNAINYGASGYLLKDINAESLIGAVKNAMILSVPEGHDKPLKYPLIFQRCGAMIVNKTDVLPYFDFDLDKVTEFARQRNPGMQIFPISAKTGEGVEALAAWICAQICKEKEKKETRL